MIGIQNSINLLSYGSNLTLIILFASLAIFGWLAIRCGWTQVHLIAAAFLAIILWLRLYQVRSSGRKTIDKLESVGEGDVENANENI